MLDMVKQEMTAAIRVVIAGDYPFFRRGIRSYIEENSNLLVVGETDSAENLFQLCDEASPDLLLLDTCLSGSSSTVFVQALSERYPHLKKIVFISPEDEDALATCIADEVNGCILKNAHPDLILKAIRSVVGGECWIQREMTQIIATRLRRVNQTVRAQNASNLTRRETEVIRLLAHGLRNQEIAEQLFISERTVKVHISSIFDKLGVHDRVKAARYAIQSGIAVI